MKIIINPIGGLANRMRALVSGIALAQKMRADFRVIWLRNWELNAKFEDLFEMPEVLKGKISYPSKPVYGLCYSVPRKKNLYITSLTWKRFEEAISDNTPRGQQLLRNADLDNRIEALVSGMSDSGTLFLQGGIDLYNSYSPDYYRQFFRLNQEIQQRVDETCRSLGPNRVGLHIRRTDNEMSVTHSPDILFEEKIREELGQNPDTRFYLASDDQAVKTKFAELFPKSVHVLPETSERGTREGMQNAAYELFVLTNTSKIYGSYYSSFSGTAALLGDIPLQELYAGPADIAD